ncbi:kinase-like domain-containing protein [Mycena sanguinolenta]|nr:kinase-like domain-containing protein [Mycena sanguinolenta]
MPLEPILKRARTVAADFDPEVHFPSSPGGLIRTLTAYSSTLYDRRPISTVHNDTRLTTRSGKSLHSRMFAALRPGHDHDDLPKQSQSPSPLRLVPDLSSESDESNGSASFPMHLGLSQTSTVAGTKSPHQIPFTANLAANTAGDVLPKMQAELNPYIVLDEPSPEARKSVNRSLESPDVHRDNTLTPTTSVPNAALQHLQRQHAREQRTHFPRFVHPHPDKGMSPTDWIRKQQHSFNYSFGSPLSSSGYGLSSLSSGTGTIDSLARHTSLHEPPSASPPEPGVALEDPHAHGYVNDLLRTWERRGPLLSMLMADSNEGRFSDELREDLENIEAQIGMFLTLILQSGDARREARQLTGSNAQSLIDAIQDVLNRGTLPDAASRSKARQLLQKVSEAGQQLPSSLFITGVNDHDEHPTFAGGFGDVFRASYQGRMVALKRIRIFTAHPSTHRNRLQFCKEALVWQGLSHRFILPLLGIDRSTFAPSFCMVSPWMKHGTVVKYLQDRGRGEVNRLLLEIAQSLDYLHSMDVVHGDLRGSNILISDDGNACLSDFGLATIISDPDSTVGMLSSTKNHGGSARWFAPELIEWESFGCERFSRTTASDVYAYACVCLELYTGSPPFAELHEVAAMMKVIKHERPEQPPDMSAALWQLVSTAWVSDFRNRPSIHDIALELDAMFSAS